MAENFIDPSSKDTNVKDELDDILGLGNDFVEANVVTKSTDVPISSNVTSGIVSNSANVETETCPELMGSDYPEDYVKMVLKIKRQYENLPKLNYDSIYKEISELSVKSSPTPSLAILNDELHKVQAAKDRLSEIFIDIIKCYNYKKRAVDILKDAWGKFTSEKNAEGRKGDASFRLSSFLSDFAETEALSKSCDHILRNLDSLNDNLSRRITIWQIMTKLQDIGRGALPNLDFDRSSKSIDSGLFGDTSEDSKDSEEGGKEIQLRSF